MRNRKNRVLSFAMSLLLVAGMLPVSVFAADCEHTELINGVCQNETCGESFAAAVNGTLYDSLDKALKAAKDDKASQVSVFTDLTDQTLELGEICLVVEATDSLVFENCTFTGKNEQQLLWNKGNLILKNVTAQNTKGKYAVFSECTEGTDLMELSVIGGSYTGKEYGIGLKQAKLQLGGGAMGEEPVKAPAFMGETAEIQLEDSVIEVLCDLGEGGYKVENRTPGVFAFVSDYEENAAAGKGWFKSVNAEVRFQEETKEWSVSGSVAEAVTVDQTEFVYNGAAQAPVITKAELYGKELIAGTDYMVSYTKDEEAVENTVNAGKYRMVINGQGSYSGTYEIEYEIAAATPVLAWEQTTEQLEYSGKSAVLGSKVNVTLLNEETFDGTVNYAYRANAADSFTDGLPVEVGTYEVKAVVAAAGNYTAAETETCLTLTIGKNTSAKLTVEVDTPENGHIYNGEEICPQVTVKNGEVTVPAQQYEVSYENNIHAGTAAVTVKDKGNGSYAFSDLTATFEIKPAALTVVSVDAANKVYDGTKAVTIKQVVLSGILGADEVSVSVGEGKGELSDGKAGTYDQVTVPTLTLSGKDASNYTLPQPTAAVKTNVTVTKAELSAALVEIKMTTAMNTEALVVEKLGAGMPADAGKLTYTAKNQDTSKGAEVVVLDWKVDENGKLTSKLVPGKAGEQVIYDVTISSENYKDSVVRVVVTLGELTLDASKVTVTLGASELTYNGKEQKPAVEVKYGDTVLKSGTDYDLKYPTDSTSVGEKELTVTFKGNYSGSTTAKYTIAKAKVSVSGVSAENKTYDGTTTAKVTAKLSGVVSGDDVTVTATGIFADKNSGSNKSINVTYKLGGEDAANYELTASNGTTTAKISPVAASSISSQISGLSVSNVDSSNKYALQTAINRANSALEDTGLSAAEKTSISNVKWSAEDMISRVESASAAAATESIRKSADITKENVTLNDKALLEKAQSDLNNALTSYGGNYTIAEESDMGNKKTRIVDALTVITRVQSAQTLIGALPEQITEETVMDTVLQTSVNDAKTAFDALNDYEKSLLGEDTHLKLTSVVEATENQRNNAPEKDQTNTLISPAPEEGETFKFPTWILVVAVIAAGLCGGGLFIYKRKQEENEYNW